jgi:hypothetical protein
VGLESPEVRDEIKRALELKKDVIPCLNNNVKETDIKTKLPEIGNKQWIPFVDKYDLADKVTSHIKDKVRV